MLFFTILFKFKIIIIGVIKVSRTVLVTGSSSGLGATIVKTLARQKYNVVINYYKSKDAAEKLVSEIGKENAIAIQADVTDRSEEHTSELQSRFDLVCRLLLEKKNT